MSENIYCVHCKSKTSNDGNPFVSRSANNKMYAKVKCSGCGHIKTSFVKSKNGKGDGIEKLTKLVTRPHPLPIPKTKPLPIPKKGEGLGDIVNNFIDRVGGKELHLLDVNNPISPKKYQFCGPGTKTDERIARGERGINALDNACMHHDVAYGKTKDKAERHKADLALAEAAKNFRNSKDARWADKLNAFLVEKGMKSKVKLGLGKKR